ncbi:class I adenylate-forming enzyme family protein [Rhodococcus artemisiae]|uniref:AMP-binding protein n=1 Tax=Rhodococcus artemisiae TaxID=714159 RepID=A0ABU7LC90_9NOCA|nr:AMP-binding protein [Rhodococcus artemisiae]MEE2058527.1 AMP-binding protein [Rhodococcus artemisiae]
MSVSLLLEMAVSADPDRVAVVSENTRVTAAELHGMARRGGTHIAGSGARSVVYVGTGGAMLPLLIFASAHGGIPFTPLNYRLGEGALHELIARLPEPLVVADREYLQTMWRSGADVIESQAFLDLASASGDTGEEVAVDPDDVAVVLFTSGTTSKPKAVELSHSNLSGYVMATVEFASAGSDDAALVCVPPYHVAGVSAALSNLYAGRRVVYLRQFDAQRWVSLVRSENITNGTVVPTMLERIVVELEHNPTSLPSLRALAYGGSKVALPLVRRTLELLPDVGLVNAYGLTETSSTIAVLTPEDHWAARDSHNPEIVGRLGSVGRPVPGIEIQIRDESGTVLPAGAPGQLFVRGPQVSGRYTGIGSVLDDDGWFPTRDLATVDRDGYVFVAGRSDDTIIRGGENIAPAEVEEVLVEHPDVAAVAVVGVEDDEWGQAMVAVVVPRDGTDPDAEDLRAFVRSRARGSRTPDRIVFRGDLPVTETGKLLRRVLVAELTEALQYQGRDVR